MSTVQEAASLFGSGLDEGSDPFGSVVNYSSNSAQDLSPFSQQHSASSMNTGPTLAQGKVATLNTHDCQPADDLFSGTPVDDADNLFGAGGAPDSEWLATGDANTDAGDTQGRYSEYSNHTNASSLAVVNESQGFSGYRQVQQERYQTYGTSERIPHRS